MLKYVKSFRNFTKWNQSSYIQTYAKNLTYEEEVRAINDGNKSCFLKSKNVLNSETIYLSEIEHASFRVDIVDS